MSIQTIIDNATSLTIDKGKIAAQSVSRSGVVLTAERATNVPYRFSVTMHEGLTYSTNRDVLEELDKLDITTEEQIDFGGGGTGLSYITAYQGDAVGYPLTLATIGNNTQEFYIDASGTTGSGQLFKKGDFIHPKGNTSTYRYPYQVTSDVAGIGSSNVTVPVHRPVISQDGVDFTSGDVKVGIDVQWYVKMLQKVDYTILPYDRIRFNGRFDLVEIITT